MDYSCSSLNCRLPHTSSSEFCSTCIFKKNTETFLEFIETIKNHNKTNKEILEIFNSDSIQQLLPSCLRWAKTLDELFAEFYKRSKPLLHAVILSFQKKSNLNTNLILRISDHKKTSICPTYMYMLIHNLYEGDELPRNCVRCMAHTIRYSTLFVNRTWRSTIKICTKLIKNELGSEKFFFAFYDIVTAFAESNHLIVSEKAIEEFIQEMRNMAILSNEHTEEEIQTFFNKLYEHPYLGHLTQKENLNTIIKPILKRRNSPWREELTAKAWHPCRYQGWCYDSEQIDELHQEGGVINYIPIQPGKKAEWDIEW